MESTTEVQIDLFGEVLPGIDEIERLSQYVHSGERNEIQFASLLEDSISKLHKKQSELVIMLQWKKSMQLQDKHSFSQLVSTELQRASRKLP